MKKKYHGFKFLLGIYFVGKTLLVQNRIIVVLYKIFFAIYSFKKQKLIICSNLIYQRCVSYMQTYHPNRFIHQYKIL